MHLHRLADEWVALPHRVDEFLEQFGQGSPELLRQVGLRDLTRLYHSVFETVT